MGDGMALAIDAESISSASLSASSKSTSCFASDQSVSSEFRKFESMGLESGGTVDLRRPRDKRETETAPPLLRPVGAPLAST